MSINEKDFKFDWYRVGIHDSPDSVLFLLRERFGDVFDFVPARNPLYGYRHAVELSNKSTKLCLVQWGDGIVGDSVMLEVSGGRSPDVSEFLKGSFAGDYHIMRADVALDICDERITFDYVCDRLIEFALSAGLQTTTVGDWATSRKGRTLYVGSRSSENFLRVYEKGKQLGEDERWFRIETESKPKDLAKRLAFAACTPLQLFSSNQAAAFALALLDVVPDIVTIESPENVSDRQNALLHLLKQYSNTLCYFADRDAGFYQWLEKEAYNRRTDNSSAAGGQAERAAALKKPPLVIRG